MHLEWKIIFKDKMGKEFSGWSPNKHGNVIYSLSKNGELFSKSVRPICLMFSDETYYYYLRIQNKDPSGEYNQFYMNGLFIDLKKNEYGQLPYKDSIIFLDNIYRINKNFLNESIDENDISFIYTNSLNFQHQKEILKKLKYAFISQAKLITIQTIQPFLENGINNLLKNPKTYQINNKKLFFNNISKIEYTTTNQIISDNRNSTMKTYTFNKNNINLMKKFQKNEINRMFMYTKNLLEFELKKIEKLENENNQKIIRESKPKNWERER